ncbi:MAG: hypothetical protein LIP03_12550 [Bacteroidales bacterium]|nr:hypothetical protein [Bacteroidales bacterium]
MKRLTILASVAMLAAACYATQVVRVESAEGVKGEFVLADSPTVSYVAEGLQITAGETQVVLPAEETYSFKICEGAGIADADIQQINISRNGSQVEISGLAEGAQVAAYGVDGRQIAQARAVAGAAVLDLSAARGVVIISTPTMNFKILK